jgi:drug/metabolite transporter (DMT)-like permease
MKLETKNRYAKILLFLATLIWGSSFVVLKNAINTLPPYFVLAVRGSIAVVILSVIFWKKFRLITRVYIWEGAIIGTLLIAAYSFQTFGLAGSTPGKNAFLTSVYCVLVPFFYWAMTKVRPDRYNVIAAFLCVIGIGLVALRGDSFSAGQSLVATGDLLTLISGVLYAIHIVAIAKFTEGKDVILLTIIQFYFYTAIAWVMSLFFEKMPSSIGLADGASLLYLGVFATAIALLFQSIGQKYTPASQASIILSLEGVFGVILSVLLYKEVVTPRLAAGFAVIFFSVLISETKMNVHPVAYLQDVYAKITDKKNL